MGVAGAARQALRDGSGIDQSGAGLNLLVEPRWRPQVVKQNLAAKLRAGPCEQAPFQPDEAQGGVGFDSRAQGGSRVGAQARGKVQGQHGRGGLVDHGYGVEKRPLRGPGQAGAEQGVNDEIGLVESGG